jgi:hypothetical protein
MGLWTDKYPEAKDVSRCIFSSVVVGACRCSECAPHADFKAFLMFLGSQETSTT